MTRLILPLRVQEVTTAGFGGTGNVLLDGVPASPAGRVSFADGVGHGNKVRYCIDDGAGGWEVTEGTLDTSGSPHELSRLATPIASSNAGAKVSFSAGVKAVFNITQDHGRVLLETLDAAASASLDFSGIDDSFDEYMFKLTGIVPGTNDVSFLMRVDEGAGFVATGTPYTYAGRAMSDVNTSDTRSNSTAANQIPLHHVGTLGNDTGESLSGRVYLHNPASATLYTLFDGVTVMADANAGRFNHSVFGGQYKDVSAVTGVQFLMDSGTIASGRISLYGLRN